MNMLTLFVFKGKLYFLVIPFIIFQIIYIFFNCINFIIIEEKGIKISNRLKTINILWNDIKSVSISKIRGLIVNIIIAVNNYNGLIFLDFEKGRSKIVRLLKIIYLKTNSLPQNIDEQPKLKNKILSYNVENIMNFHGENLVKIEYLKIIFFLNAVIILMILNLIPFYQYTIKFWSILLITLFIFTFLFGVYLLIKKIICNQKPSVYCNKRKK